MDFYIECKNKTIEDIKQMDIFKSLPDTIKKRANRIKHKKELCKFIVVANETNSLDFINIISNLPSDMTIESVLKRIQIPSKYFKIVKPTYRFFHGRSVTRSAKIWNSAKSFKRVMWWAIDITTPLMYASTSIKGRELDSSLRWDLYEARVKKDEKLMLITIESIKWLIKNLGNLSCEGKTLGHWLNKTFPIKRGKLHRVSYIESDRKMANCLCTHIGAIGYIAPEIDVYDGFGQMHKEAMFCNPEKHLKLKKFSVFTTRKSQNSVEDYLNKENGRLRPDLAKEFK